MKAYHRLEKIFEKLHGLSSATAILHWDSAVVMPPGGAPARAEQLATLNTTCHEIITSEEVSDLLDEAEESTKKLDEWQKANLQLMRHRWKHSNAVDEKLVEAFTKAASECEMVWRSARAGNDFKKFAPYLQKVLNFSREAAERKAKMLGCSPYDALLDQFDAGRKSKEIDAIFSDLEAFLPSFIQNVADNQRTKYTPSPINGIFPTEKQRALGLKFMSDFGINFNNCRLDISHHPFCGGVYSDIRITTRYDENNFMPALMGVLHESGHALYESGLPYVWHRQPVGSALGMSIHESQSLLIEMQVCRSRDFLMYAAPIIASAFGGVGKEWQAENIHKIYSRVEPGLIRVDADEVTYPAHIILRYRIEKALISGEMEVEDIPGEWNNEMKKLLNIKVPNDKDGCMQDIHWSDGSFGYFPTYTLGAMHAAQFFAKAKKDNPSIVNEIKKGNFKPLVSWLTENIHNKGSLFTANQLLENVTGEELNVNIYKNYLKNRYLS